MYLLFFFFFFIGKLKLKINSFFLIDNLPITA